MLYFGGFRRNLVQVPVDVRSITDDRHDVHIGIEASFMANAAIALAALGGELLLQPLAVAGVVDPHAEPVMVLRVVGHDVGQLV